MSTSPSLRIFGFPVDVRPGFVMLLALFAFINRGELGLWLAGCVGIFTLIHELGHAFAARATGAKASIALDFLAGYASFEPTRPLKRWERAGISVAGPAVQITLGVAILALMGVNPLNYDQVHSTAPALAVWWAGPVIGLVNLLPILPLDGGNIVDGLAGFARHHFEQLRTVCTEGVSRAMQDGGALLGAAGTPLRASSGGRGNHPVEGILGADDGVGNRGDAEP